MTSASTQKLQNTDKVSRDILHICYNIYVLHMCTYVLYMYIIYMFTHMFLYMYIYNIYVLYINTYMCVYIYIKERETREHIQLFSSHVKTAQRQEVSAAQDEVKVARGERAFSLCSNQSFKVPLFPRPCYESRPGQENAFWSDGGKFHHMEWCWWSLLYGSRGAHTANTLYFH